MGNKKRHKRLRDTNPLPEHFVDTWPTHAELQEKHLQQRDDVAETLYGLLLAHAPRSKKDSKRASISLGSKKPMSEHYVCDVPLIPGGEEIIRLRFSATERLLTMLAKGLGHAYKGKKKKAYAWLETMQSIYENHLIYSDKYLKSLLLIDGGKILVCWVNV